MQKLIENAIRKSLNRHLVQHVNVLPDKRCRVDIMVEEATNEILKLVVQPDVKSNEAIQKENKKESEETVCPKCKSNDWDGMGRYRRCNMCNERWTEGQTDF